TGLVASLSHVHLQGRDGRSGQGRQTVTRQLRLESGDRERSVQHRIRHSHESPSFISASIGRRAAAGNLGALVRWSMDRENILNRISRGRTDLVFDLLRLADWREALSEGPVGALKWLVYYGDVTAMKAILDAGGGLAGLDLNEELGHAAFF